MAVTIRARGTWETAVQRAAEYGNRFARAERLDRAEQFLARAGWASSTFGREYVACADNELTYLNTGETYDLTVCQENDGRLFVSSWGAWYEEAEQAHEQETDTIRCGYCGEFTPLCDEALAQPAGARHAWRKTVCEHCGYLVGG
jgi:hypothetical protein